jgi:Resolvase, N terminal domain
MKRYMLITSYEYCLFASRKAIRSCHYRVAHAAIPRIVPGLAYDDEFATGASAFLEAMKKGLLLGYARVSKVDDQDNAAQVKELRQAGCKRVFEEKASGGRWDRPQLHNILDQLREGDVLVVWKLDHLSRSLKDLLHIMEKVCGAGAGFRSLTEAVDTTTPAGRMMMQMLGSFAEFERSMVRERTGPA